MVVTQPNECTDQVPEPKPTANRQKEMKNTGLGGRTTTSPPQSSECGSPAETKHKKGKVKFKLTPKGSTDELVFLIAKILVASIGGVMAYYYYLNADGNNVLASVGENITERSFIVKCSDDYANELKKFQGCAPTKCGRFIRDSIVTAEEVRRLLKLAVTGMSYGGSSGAATILDLHSGALSKDDKFINIYKLIESRTQPIFEEDDFILYRNVKKRIKHEITKEFGIPVAKLYLTKPTFFSRMDTKPARTVHDEYWHPHIDKETYGSFHYTSLLYLTDYGADFTGGRFVFVDKGGNRTVEPRKGRLSFFTSGSENQHYVEKLESGTRYAITVSFTCDPQQAIPDPRLPKPKGRNSMQGDRQFNSEPSKNSAEEGFS